MPPVLKSWGLNLLEYPGLVQACNGIALLIMHSGVATMASGSNGYDIHKFCENDIKTEILVLVFIPFHWHMQNAMIPCHSQELLPFLSRMLHTFSCHPSPPTILPSSLTSSCHLFLGLPLKSCFSEIHI